MIDESAELRDQVASAQGRLTELTTQAELAADRGARGPTPRDIADAEGVLKHFQRRLELALSEQQQHLNAECRRTA